MIADDGQDRYALNTGNSADGQPNFALTVIAGSPSEFGNTISVGDLNNDGRTDVIVTDIDADLGPFCPSSAAVYVPLESDDMDTDDLDFEAL